MRTTLRPILEGLGDQPTSDRILDLKVCDPAMGSGAFLVEACRHLADKLVASWVAHDSMPEIPSDEDPILHARRLVAQRCLYGVDKNPFAVNLAKLSLWLVTLAKDHPFTFIDQSLKHGDSLVGLTRKQIAAFHWNDQSDQDLPLFKWVAEQIGKAKSARADIFALGDEHEAQKRAHWREAEDALAEARLTGDLAVSAFFSGDKDKARETRRKELWEKVQTWRRGGRNEGELRGVIEDMREAERPVAPLHWEVEFPEVFDRENPGFDAFVGNPPFGGKNNIVNGNAGGYLDWIKALHEGAHGNADLVAHFFRRTFGLLRATGTLGLIATNTIAQGDTRATGLRWICSHGGSIYKATRRYKWPGAVAVVVSVIHVRRGGSVPARRLDGRPTERITAFLFHRGGNDDPKRLDGNANLCFQGTNVLGIGFTFDDEKPVATSVSEMHRLIASDPRNSERIFPYIGGKQVNSDPTQAHSRYVINFGDMTEAEARRWPALFEIIEKKVKPDRLRNKRDTRRKYWWRFGETTPALFAALSTCERVLVCSQVTAHLAFVFVPARMVLSHKLSVFPLESPATFCGLQCRLHEIWARFFSGTAMDLLRYTPTDCFETFPFPVRWMADERLDKAGEEYSGFRASLMVQEGIGLTAIYNRFHDPDESSPDITKLRALHDLIDRAVLDAYGWDDIKPTCEFLLDYDEDDEDGSSKRKKPWRYRWPDEVQEDVLARLLDLNQQRAEEERQAGLLADKKGKKKPGRKKGGKKKPAKKKSRKKVDSSQSQTALSFGKDGS